ncbi:hypothetical protein PTSG_12321 [Salpingoeca rosetta]|uniref:Inward rectifier potassium channel C-terminal domain-containing protein n=1 Tax=Salpingoeca rosetta (strain ATCC 50818 / BSB-021) TaxID=946362 RepID=F2UBA2_SALR5|nr:uncharacterized protein PTSG_12321 [Salpingoeca rosetta]EGD73768.1 hypothetical protein PTSG_12321 [Salpingoeca rosetta]|eukprot:XP_004993331.1 hypothetical protein PTSG_12321 [Salpingoeca rosetta]
MSVPSSPEVQSLADPEDVYLPPDEAVLPAHPRPHSSRTEHDHKTASKLRAFFRKMRGKHHHHDDDHDHDAADHDGQEHADATSLADGGTSQDSTDEQQQRHRVTSPQAVLGGGATSPRPRDADAVSTTAASATTGSAASTAPSSAATSPNRRRSRLTRRRTGTSNASNTNNTNTNTNTSTNTNTNDARTAAATTTTTTGTTGTAAGATTTTTSARSNISSTRTVQDERGHTMVVYDENTNLQVSGTAQLSKDKRDLVEIKGLPNMLGKYVRHRARRLLLVFGVGLACHFTLALVFAMLLRVLFPRTLVGRSPEAGPASFCHLVYHLFSASIAGYTDTDLIVNDHAVVSFGVLLVNLNLYIGFILRCLAILATLHPAASTPPFLRFSKWAVVTSKSLTGLRSLEFRLVNDFGFDREMLDARASVTMSITPANNPTRRRFFPLRLVRDAQAVMPVLWTVSHVIDHNSPLYDQTSASLEDNMALFEVVVDCVDPVTRQRVYHRHTYSAATVIFHAEFAVVADTSGFPKKAHIDFNKLHTVYQHAQ